MAEESGKALRRVLAANLRRLRKDRGFSQEGFAAECGLHRTFIGAVERAEPNISIDNIARIARALDEPAWRLLRGEDAEA